MDMFKIIDKFVKIQITLEPIYKKWYYIIKHVTKLCCF